jgi:hypothetical protein
MPAAISAMPARAARLSGLDFALETIWERVYPDWGVASFPRAGRIATYNP